MQIELEHIRIEIVNGRGQHLRHFIDQYFCYQNGYVTKSCKADWNKIFWHEWVSDAAQLQHDKKSVTKEHVIPLLVIKTMLMDLGSRATHQKIAAILDKFVILATITKREDLLLRKAGLSKKMPANCYSNNVFNSKSNAFARYKAVGINGKMVHNSQKINCSTT